MLEILPLVGKVHEACKVHVSQADGLIFLIKECNQSELHEHLLRSISDPPDTLDHGYPLASKQGNLVARVNPELPLGAHLLRGGLPLRVQTHALHEYVYRRWHLQLHLVDYHVELVLFG